MNSCVPLSLLLKRQGTARSPQEYVNPILVLSGREYASISFVELHTRICDALRGSGPAVVAQSFTAAGVVQLVIYAPPNQDTRKSGRGVVEKD